MRNVATILGAAGMAILLSGCPIFIDTEESDPPPDCGWGCADECTTDMECPPGYFCDGGSCNATWFCDWDDGCPPGYHCDERDTCVPGDVGPDICESDADCPDGYCNIPGEGLNGLCVDTGACTEDADCIAYGPGLACDERGICVPEEAPCPDGECGCTDDSECTDGNLCISSRCTDVESICIFDFECGMGTCIDNACHASCEAEAVCPTGQGCNGEFCLDLPVGADGCVFDEDCGEAGFRCINASCHATCNDDSECSSAETCSSGVCRADTAPVRSCSVDSGDCTDGKVCVRGFCRMPCAGDINCTSEGEMSVCDDGFCRFQVELVPPECLRGSDCYGDSICLNGSCTVLPNE